MRIGIAIADTRLGIASPYQNYVRTGPAADASHFRRLVREELIVRFVVGLPVHASGDESRLSSAARAFGAWLGEVTGIAVEFFDERFTTSEALRHLSAAQLTSKQRKSRLDKLAAQIMLTAYLESPRDEDEGTSRLDD